MTSAKIAIPIESPAFIPVIRGNVLPVPENSIVTLEIP